MADHGIATIWGATGAKPTAIIVNPADYPLLSDKAAVGPGDGIGAEVVRFNGYCAASELGDHGRCRGGAQRRRILRARHRRAAGERPTSTPTW